MLVFTRLKGQSIALFGGLIQIDIIKTDSRRVQVGITAPEEVDIHRLEISQKLADQDPGRAALADRILNAIRSALAVDAASDAASSQEVRNES